jgi:hypothetical protein
LINSVRAKSERDVVVELAAALVAAASRRTALIEIFRWG